MMAIGGCKAKKNRDAAGSPTGEASSQFDSYFIDACTHANTGNYEVALRLFNKCKDLKPAEASVYYEMSKLYEKTDDKTQSLQSAMKAWEYAPTNTFYALWYAQKLRQNGQVDQAIEVLEKIYDAHKKEEHIAKELDYLYDRKNATAKRIELWNTYQSARGYKLSAALKLVDLYKSQKDYKSAHMIYDQIKKASPGKYQYFIDDANLYLEHGDEVNANINFEKAIEINPNNWKVNYALYKSYRAKKDKQKAGVYLKQAFGDVNTSFDSKISACMELNTELKTDSSARYFTNIVALELVRLYQGNASALLTAAGFFEENGQTAEALDNYQKAYGINPNMYDAWIGAINASEKLGLTKNVASTSEKALEYYPNVASLYATAAKAWNQLLDHRKALELSISGKSFALDNEVTYLLLVQEGYAQFRLKSYREAEKAYAEAMAINSTEKELYDQIGNVQFFLGKTDEAVNSWKKAKELGLRNTTIDKKINDRKFHE